MKNNDIKNERLSPLSHLKDYKVAKDNPDVVGWRVVGSDGESLGVVKDLIVDLKAMKVRYLSVVADRKFFNAGTDQHMLIPIGAAALDKGGKNVFVSSIDSRNIQNYPVYEGGPVPEDYEYAVRDTYYTSQKDTFTATNSNYTQDFEEAMQHPTAAASHRSSDDFYNDDVYNEDRFYASNQEGTRHKSYNADELTSSNQLNASTSDLHSQDKRPKTVEDSIATIERLEQLRERGTITEEEFILLKKRALDL